MRMLLNAERAFTEKVVKETDLLLQSDLSEEEKLSELNRQIEHQEERINWLQRFLRRVRGNAERATQVRRLIELREKTLSFLLTMCRFVEARLKPASGSSAAVSAGQPSR